MAKPIFDFDELKDYFTTEEKVLELLNNLKPYIRRVELIAQKMRTGNIDSSIEFQKTRSELSGIYTTLNKISKMAYGHANNVKNKAMVKDLDDYLKEPWTAEEKKTLKDGTEKTNNKVIPFSSTISKAKAEKESHPFFRVANYIKSYVDSIEQMSMALSSQSKLQSRFGQGAENEATGVEEEEE